MLSTTYLLMHIYTSTERGIHTRTIRNPCHGLQKRTWTSTTSAADLAGRPPTPRSGSAATTPLGRPPGILGEVLGSLSRAFRGLHKSHGHRPFKGHVVKTRICVCGCVHACACKYIHTYTYRHGRNVYTYMHAYKKYHLNKQIYGYNYIYIYI